MENKKKLLIALAFLTVAGISGGIWYASTLKQNTNRGTVATPPFDLSPYERTAASSKNFVKGEKLLQERQAEEAASYLEKALSEVNDIEEEAQVKYSLALAYSSTRKNSDGYKKAITLVKEIVANPNYSASVKALSLEVVERLLSSSVSKEAASYIAEDPEYAALYTNQDVSLLRKNILIRAETLYPLAGVEMKLAALYAKDLLDLVEQNRGIDGPNDDQIKLNRQRVLSSITKGTTDIRERMDVVPRLAVYTPEVYLYKSIAAERFEDATGETPFGNIDELYRFALETGRKYYRPQLPLIEYYYAAYLAKADDSTRYAEVQELLKPYQNPGSEKAYMAGVFSKEKDNVLGEKANLVRLARIDSSFKNYLLKLGWPEDSFTDQ